MTIKELQEFMEETIDSEFEEDIKPEDTPSALGIDSLDLALLGQELREETGKDFDVEPNDTFGKILDLINN